MLGNFGLFAQTGAWEGENTENMGVFYAQVKATASVSSKNDLRNVFGQTQIKSAFLCGYSFETGVEINQVINLKLSLYQYINDIKEFRDPVFKVSLDYSIK